MSVPQTPIQKPGSKPASSADAPVAATAKPAQPPQLASAVPTPGKSPAAFGGHRGGGKRREDGLIAGSPEAKEADRKKDAERKKAARLASKMASLPSPLPGVSLPAQNSAPPVSSGQPALPGVTPGPGVATAVPAASPAALVPTFIAWTKQTLARPVRLLTRILDRIRVSALMQRIRKLNLKPEQEKEIESDIAYKEAALSDFNEAVSNCLAIELNKRNVPGAQYSHFIDVLMTGGELVHTHLSVVDKLEAMIAANEAERQKAMNTPKPKETAPTLTPAQNTPAAILGRT